MKVSKHCEHRMQNRAINSEMLALLEWLGIPEPQKGGTELIRIGKNDRCLLKKIAKALNRLAENNVGAVTAGELTVTTFHQTKRIKRSY